MASVAARRYPRSRLSVGDGCLAVGLAAMALPDLYGLANQTWTREFGAYGPIVLAAGLWLLGRKWGQLQAEATPGPLWVVIGLLAPSLASFVIGLAYDFLTLETAGLYGVALAMLVSRFGVPALRKQWFPLLYLAFVIPPPNSVLSDVTAPLKELVSNLATGGADALGLPVARSGVTIFVAQYQLLVEDACSGMNSLVGLIAVGLLYVYLMRGSSWRYAAALTTCIIPIAIFANVLRIMVLILLTYFYGNEVAQSFLHFWAGMLLFMTALLGVFALDQGVAAVRSRLGRTA